MPIHGPRQCLLAYDIADPERLVRVHRAVRRWGVPLQYSVFLIPSSAAAIDSLLGELGGIIDDCADDVRVYPLPTRLEMIHYGRQVLPEGVQLIGGAFSGQCIDALAGPGLRQ
ncbi:MAG: CRISPR-associated endonuclease Cas2 [Pseudomonadota bacterium]|nr:CRISPR-associated endonuclease Cas2 [Pseudomonadota bacterium]